MRADLFDYPLPRESIALRPARPRDQAKLLVIERGCFQDEQTDDRVIDLPRFLRPGDMLVINDSPTMPARLYGTICSGRTIEVLLCQPEKNCWRVMARPAKHLRRGGQIHFDKNLTAEIIAPDLLRFDRPEQQVFDFLAQQGQMPLPPYIIAQRAADEQDRRDYQTIYHQRDHGWGSIAAPTAGLHFTQALLDALSARDVLVERVTLHVGAGTFAPVRTAQIEDHEMSPERAALTAASAERINKAKAAGGRVIAVGTTSLRLLESASSADGVLSAFEGTSDLFIRPGYQFRIADGIMTNFHLPRSTPLMLAAAFCGLAELKRAYAHALAHSFRFFSYGDACLLLR